MAKILATALDRDGVTPRPLSPRLRSQLNYFVAASSGPHVDNEFRFDPDEVRRWVDDGVILLVSPLDTAHATEVELSEEQEDFLGWLLAHEVWHIRVDE
jgi:hypothetical protein